MFHPTIDLCNEGLVDEGERSPVVLTRNTRTTTLSHFLVARQIKLSTFVNLWSDG